MFKKSFFGIAASIIVLGVLISLIVFQAYFSLTFSDVKFDMQKLDEFDWETFDIDLYKNHDGAQVFWNKIGKPSEKQEDYYRTFVVLYMHNRGFIAYKNFIALLEPSSNQTAYLFKVPEAVTLSVEQRSEKEATLALFYTCSAELSREEFEQSLQEGVLTVYYEGLFGVKKKKIDLSTAKIEYRETD